MPLLKPASNQTAYMKVGMLGFQGSGKTFTATRLASGLCRLSGKDNPKVAFFDTEKGSDFFINYFNEQNIQYDVAKSRTFIDLIAFMKEAEANKYDVVIIDSISHVWQDLTLSFQKRLRKDRLSMQNWGTIKQEWRQFTDLFINSKMHAIVLGRAGYTYDFVENEDGKTDLVKTGTKMKVEGEFGYESDLLLEMERVPNAKGKGWINRCTVLKDRTDTMNGKVIDYPKFENFEPVVKHLNIGGEHFGLDANKDSQNLFADPDYSYAERKKQQEIALEELNEAFVLREINGTGKSEVQQKVNLLIKMYGTSSKTALEQLTAEEIRHGLKRLKNGAFDEVS